MLIKLFLGPDRVSVPRTGPCLSLKVTSVHSSQELVVSTPSFINSMTLQHQSVCVADVYLLVVVLLHTVYYTNTHGRPIINSKQTQIRDKIST